MGVCRSVFYFLSAFGVIVLLIMVVVLPEVRRNFICALYGTNDNDDDVDPSINRRKRFNHPSSTHQSIPPLSPFVHSTSEAGRGHEREGMERY
jgi:hypothetical protein